MSTPAESPSRTWLVDLGNTRIKWARADELATDAVSGRGRAESFDAARIDAWFDPVQPGDRVWLASVTSPAATADVEASLERRGAVVTRALTRPALAGVRIAYAEPSRLGVDRFLALLAAHARGREAWLIASIGTALTIDLLDAGGTHHGGLIAPSPTLMREALSRRAPHLPTTGGSVVEFADDTTDALASGAILSARALVEHALRAAEARLGVTPALLVTGGGSDAVLDGWRVRAVHALELVLEGLAVYAQAASAGIDG